MNQQLPPYPPGEVAPAATTPAPETVGDTLPAWLIQTPQIIVVLSTALLLFVVVCVLGGVLIRRLWRKAHPTTVPVSFTFTDADGGPLVADEDAPDEGSSPKKPRRSREERADMIRTTAAPLVLGGVVLWLVFDGLEAFARDSMGLEPPMSFAVIIAFEFVAMWLCWERFARAQKNRPDVPGLVVGQWALLALAMLFQYDHAVHDELSLMGTVARVALPAILGGVVEWALHSRRTTVRSNEDAHAGRLFDHSLRSNPVLFLRSRYVLAAHADWTAEQAVQHVRTQDAKTLALRLRDLITNPPTAPAAPAPVTDPAPPFIPDGATDRERDRVQRNHERALERAENTRARRARDHEAAMVRHRRAVTTHHRTVARLRDRLVAALDALGFTGGPTDTPAADMLRAVQVGVLVDDMVTLDYANPDEAKAFFGGLITGADLEDARVDRLALEGSTPSTPGTERVDGVDEADAPASTPNRPADAAHVESTWTSTPGPGPRVDGVDRRVDGGVDRRVDAPLADPGHAPSADGFDPADAAPVHTDEAARVDGVDAFAHTGPNGVDAHMGGGWRTPGTHPTDNGDEDTDPDDDGPRGGGSAVPTPPNGFPVLAGQTTVDEHLANTARVPSVLDEIRTAMDAPTWEDATNKKERLFALLWEHAGNKTAVRTAYRDRTDEDAPTDLNRRRPGGYVWDWHHEVTTHLISRNADADTVRRTLADAGVDTDHPAVSAALDTWNAAHGDQVVPFRRLSPTGK